MPEETPQAAVAVIGEAPAQQEANKQQDEERDQFGRLATERIVELSPEDAEAIGQEVIAGKWQAYDQAMHYVIARGVAEIKRTRDNAAKLLESKLLKAKRDNWSKLLSSNPKLLENNDLIATMLKELGVTKPTASK